MLLVGSMCQHGYLSGVMCRFAYGPTDTSATHCVLLQEIQIGFGFTFLVPAHPGSPGQNPESRKTVLVLVVVVVLTILNTVILNVCNSACSLLIQLLVCQSFDKHLSCLG